MKVETIIGCAITGLWVLALEFVAFVTYGGWPW